VLDDVAPEVLVAPVAVGSVPVDVDVEPPAVEVEGEVPVVGAAVDPVDDSLVDVELDAVVDDDSEDAPVVSAAAKP
jgi:hypothetical protein